MFHPPRSTSALRTFIVIILVTTASTPAVAQKIGPEFRVNTTTAGDQILPAVAINAIGRYVVVWASDGTDGSGLGVYGQRFFPNGNKLGTQFRVNDYTDNDQDRPAVALRDDGSFVVTWSSRGQDGDGNGIFARMFDAAGNKIGPEFQVNIYTFSNESAPHVFLDPDGNFVIVWQSTQQDGSSDAAMARRYDPDGVPLTGEIMVNRYAYGFQGCARVGCADSGDFVVTYCSWEFDGSDYAAAVQRVGKTGGLTGDELLANTYTEGHQDYPDIAVNPDGSFVVVWHSILQDGSGYGVYGQRFRSNGTRAGGEFRVNTETFYSQWWTRVASDGFGSYAVAWQGYSRTGQNDIYLRRYQSDGTVHTGEIRVNAYTGGNQEKPDIAAGPDGNLVVVWQSFNQDGSGYGVYGQRFAAGTVPVLVSGLTAEVAGNRVSLQWDVESDEEITGTAIYRTSRTDGTPVVFSADAGARRYVDTDVEPATYTYAVEVHTASGGQIMSRSATVTVNPRTVKLLRNYPNPFNPSTLITYELDAAGDVTLDVYDVRGTRVAVLEAGEKTAGRHEVRWNGRDTRGKPVGSGVYFCRLITGKAVRTHRMVLLK
jgi:hypothetical protein